MRIVIDANLVVALFWPLPYSVSARERITAWKRARVELLAPILLQYEVHASLHRVMAANQMAYHEARSVMQAAHTLNIHCVPPSLELHERALYWAERFGHSRTYDAQYLALAEQERVDLWTADQRLANRARQIGIQWVHRIDSESSGLL